MERIRDGKATDFEKFAPKTLIDSNVKESLK